MIQNFFVIFLFVLFVSPLNADEKERVLFSFGMPGSSNPWQPVNDGVMGGRSSGQARINQFKNMEFSGTLSLENNGGFSSVRVRDENLGLATGDSVVVRVRGDGRVYQFNLYSQRNLGGYSYRQSFRTKKGEWIDVIMPIDRFVATWRGRTFPNEKLDPKMVSGMGIFLGDKKAGPFKLEVDWIKVRHSFN